MNHSALWYFDHFGLLQGLSATQKQQVEEKTRMLHLKRGDAVYLPGDPTEHVCVVKTGAVKIVGTSPEGGAVNLAVLMPGDIFGELALTGEDTPQDDRAEAMEDTSLCEVPRDLMFSHDRGDARLRPTRDQAGQTAPAPFRTRVEELLGKSAPARVAHALLELSQQHGIRDGGGVLIPLRLSQGDLGKLVGLTRETINGIVQAGREQGVMEMDRRSIRIRNTDRLRRVR